MFAATNNYHSYVQLLIATRGHPSLGPLARRDSRATDAHLPSAGLGAAHIYIYTHMYIIIYIYIHIYIYTYVYVSLSLSLYIYIYICTYVCFSPLPAPLLRQLLPRTPPVSCRTVGKNYLIHQHHHHHHHHRSCCLNSRAFAVSEIAPRWWCIESLLPAVFRSALRVHMRESYRTRMYIYIYIHTINNTNNNTCMYTYIYI